jgi:hypothetical protein
VIHYQPNDSRLLLDLSGRRRRLFEKIVARIKVLANGCWEWQGPDSGAGRGGKYGRMAVDGATMAVHIVMWVLFNGPVPPRKQIDHECTYRRCCNPGHLEMVTHKKNQKLRARRAKMQCEPLEQAA